MAATDTESMQDNMTRLRIRMVQQKLANERERLQRPGSASSDNDDSQLKLQQAMLRRQELLDRIRQEQLVDEQRPRTYSPRRRYTPSPLPPPSRRSLPDLSRAYHFNWYNKDPPRADMAQTKHVIEHQFRHADPPTHTYRLPPIQQMHAVPAVPQVATIQTPQPLIQSLPPVTLVDGSYKPKDTMFNKADFMDMMMLQNAQMHHMVMQQMMLQNLPGGYRLPTAQVPMAPVMAEAAPMVRAAPMSYAPPVVHHYAPPLEMRAPPGRVLMRRTVPQKPALGPPIGRQTEVYNRSYYLYGSPKQKDTEKADQEEAQRQKHYYAIYDPREERYINRRKVRSSGDRGERRPRLVEGPRLKQHQDSYRAPFRRYRTQVQGPSLKVREDLQLRPQGRFYRTTSAAFRDRGGYYDPRFQRGRLAIEDRRAPSFYLQRRIQR